MKETDKYTILALLETGHSVEEIKKETNLSHAKVANLKTKYDKSIEEDSLAKLVDIEKFTAFKMRMEGKSSPQFLKELDNLGDKIIGLSILEDQVQETAVKIVKKVNEFMEVQLSMQELKVASDIITNLNNSMLKEATTQVNVQNNFVQEGNNKYKNLLSDSVLVYDNEQTSNN